MALEKLDLTCSKCSGTMDYDETKQTLRCPYCGHEEMLHQTNAASIEAKAYARQKGILLANEDAERKKRKHKRKGVILALLFVFCLVLAAFTYNSLLPKVNPFDYISVSFSGTTGDGTAEVVRQTDDKSEVNPHEITYSVEPRHYLSEGDIVTVTASSITYTLFPTSKTYRVTGLDAYLTDLQALSENAVEMIHNKSEITLSSAISGAGTSVKASSFVPCIMYLTTDGKNSNTLYDIYQVLYPEKNGGTAKRYVVIYYTDIVVRDTQEPTMSYKRTMYTGQIIETLDDSYGGYMTGYKRLKDAKADILSHQNKAVTLQERKPAQ